VGFRRADDDIRHVLDIDRPAIARSDHQQLDIGDALQCLRGDDRDIVVELFESADEKGAIGVFQLVDKLVEGNAVKRQPLRIGLNADLVRAAPDNIGQAHIIDLDQLVLQLIRLWKSPLSVTRAAASSFGANVRVTMAKSLMRWPMISGIGMALGRSAMRFRIFS
jgi:hypothetical protein